MLLATKPLTDAKLAGTIMDAVEYRDVSSLRAHINAWKSRDKVPDDILDEFLELVTSDLEEFSE
jgi:hypothetical protein